MQLHVFIGSGQAYRDMVCASGPYFGREQVAHIALNFLGRFPLHISVLDVMKYINCLVEKKDIVPTNNQIK